MEQKKKRVKLSPEKTQDILNNISLEIMNHVGQPALLFIKEGKTMMPYFVKILPNGTATYKCYSIDGLTTRYVTIYPSVVDIMTGHQVIVYFDENI